MLHSPFHSRCAACAISVRRQRLSSRIFADPHMSAVCVGHRRRVTSADGDWLRWRDLNPRHSLLYTAILFYTGPVFVVPRPVRGRLVPRFDCLGLRIPHVSNPLLDISLLYAVSLSGLKSLCRIAIRFEMGVCPARCIADYCELAVCRGGSANQK